MAAQASALAHARESQDAAEQATIAAQLSLKEAVGALAVLDAQLAMVSRDLAPPRTLPPRLYAARCGVTWGWGFNGLTRAATVYNKAVPKKAGLS